MFIISKRNFLVCAEDGTKYKIAKDFIGTIPDWVANSGLVQGAIKSGLIVAPESKKDNQINKAQADAAKKELNSDIRPDAKKNVKK